MVPFVSILMATFNRPEFLKDALESALAQTFTDFELIVVDDSSLNDPRPIVDEFNDARIHYFRQVTNVGIGSNMAFALRQATGLLVTNLHDDDKWQPDYLAVMVRALMSDPAATFAFCDHEVIDANGNINEKWTEQRSRAEGRRRLPSGRHGPCLELGLLTHTIFLGLGCVWRRPALSSGGIDQVECAGVLWDYFVVYLLVRNGDIGVYVPSRLGYWRRHDSSETMLSGSVDAAAKLRKAESELHCFAIFLQDELLISIRADLQQRCWHSQTTKAIALLRLGRKSEARQILLNRIKAKKDLRTALALLASSSPNVISRRV
jgi:glycosyltransferase involved in cell wall biosynthesis